jgi:hypothetical protein
MAQSLLDYSVNVASPAPPTGGGPVTPGPYSQASIGNGQPVGTAPLAGSHNTPLHIAAWGLGGAAVIVLMHRWGFRLVSVGRYAGGR